MDYYKYELCIIIISLMLYSYIHIHTYYINTCSLLGTGLGHSVLCFVYLIHICEFLCMELFDLFVETNVLQTLKEERESKEEKNCLYNMMEMCYSTTLENRYSYYDTNKPSLPCNHFYITVWHLECISRFFLWCYRSQQPSHCPFSVLMSKKINIFSFFRFDYCILILMHFLTIIK